MVKRIQLTLSDDFYSWVKAEADLSGIPVATMVNLLVSEARHARETVSFSSDIMRLLSSMSDSDRLVFFRSFASPSVKSICCKSSDSKSKE